MSVYINEAGMYNNPYTGYLSPYASMSYPRSSKNESVVRVMGIVEQVLEDDYDVKGAMHMHLLVRVVSVLGAWGIDPYMIGNEIFCAIRYGDKKGICSRIYDIEEGTPIILQGKYVYKSKEGSSGDYFNIPTLHFTHRPVGFVIYKGFLYE